MKTKAILIIITAILILTLSFFFMTTKITGEAIIDKYSYTKAICNESNFCQDYEIVCEGNKTIRKTPITGAVIQQPSGWKDSRTEEFLNKDC
ncbi:hypothetical protein CMI44_00085 [Candidatus Pacearchaeota archaeon]|jgi:hypothetical protein|nr:hypothetical protein [Candidatus Pacearchaeota archaeon]|tara:strand:+ start:1248 stop:1523 length:276 start_codon:yes stop_codon:yes gene_type:complete